MQATAHRVSRVIGQERLEIGQPVLDRYQPPGFEHALELLLALAASDRIGRQHGRFRDGAAQPICLTQEEIRDRQRFQQTAVQSEYRVQGGIPAAARIGQQRQHIRHGLGQNRRQLGQEQTHLRLNLLTQPRRLAGAREIGPARQVISPFRVTGRAAVHRGVEQLSHLPPQGNGTADPRMRIGQFLRAGPATGPVAS
jgi:hypothetical protein